MSGGQAAVPPAPPLRVLCLHGYRQDARSFHVRTGALRKALRGLAELVPVSAPHVLSVPGDDPGPAEAAEEAAAAGRAWWLSDPAAGTFDAAAAGDAAGLEASLAAVAAAVAERGPFDGVLGFSQGAALGAMLCALGQRGHARFAPRFALLVAGFRSRAPAHARFYAEPLAVPSLHVVGQADAVIPPARSAELAACFVAPVVLEHPGGHFVPAAAPQREAYRRFLQRFLP